MKSLDPNITVQLARIKALSDETRLKIVGMLANERLCACVILASLQITQSTLSYHMRLLTDSGLVIAERDGKWMYYTLKKENMDDLRTYLGFISAPGNQPIVMRNSNCRGKTPEKKIGGM